MKKLSTLRLAAVFAGCFLGAGYVSGQELWQYFGAFGTRGFVGLCVSAALLYLMGVLLLRLAQRTGVIDAERLAVPWDFRVLRAAFSVLELLMLFAVVSIMCAGAGALAEQLFSLPHAAVSAVFALAVLACALTGLQGIVTVFSFSVPCLVLSAVGIGAVFVLRGGMPELSAAAENPMLGGWFLSALNYASYNMFGAVAILAPFGHLAGKRSTVTGGLALGCAGLLLIAVSVLLSAASVPGAAEAELPMLFAAQSLSPWLGSFYALLMLFAMFGTSLSCEVSIVNWMAAESAAIQRHRTFFTFTVSAAAFAAGLFGFGRLIGVLYPVFGYAGAAFLVTMAWHSVSVSLKKRKTET